MKNFLSIVILSFFLFSGCSSGEYSEILKDEYFTFSLGFDGEVERSKVTGNQIELVATYTSNNKGNILENNIILIEGYECSIDSLNPQSFQLGQELKITASCTDSFEESQIEGTLVLEYLQGSTQRLSQAEFFLTVEE